MRVKMHYLGEGINRLGITPVARAELEKFGTLVVNPEKFGVILTPLTARCLARLQSGYVVTTDLHPGLVAALCQFLTGAETEVNVLVKRQVGQYILVTPVDDKIRGYLESLTGKDRASLAESANYDRIWEAMPLHLRHSFALGNFVTLKISRKLAGQVFGVKMGE